MKQEQNAIQEGKSSSNNSSIGDSPRRISSRRIVPLGGSPKPTKDDPPKFMNLNLISMSRNQRTTMKLVENLEGETVNANQDNEKQDGNILSLAKTIGANIDHTMFLEAQVRNLNEPLEDLNTQIQQESNAVNSLKVRRSRVKRLIISMLTKLLKYPVHAL